MKPDIILAYIIIMNSYPEAYEEGCRNTCLYDRYCKDKLCRNCLMLNTKKDCYVSKLCYELHDKLGW